MTTPISRGGSRCQFQFVFLKPCFFGRLDAFNYVIGDIGPCFRFGVQFSINISSHDNFLLVARIIPEDNIRSIDACPEHNTIHPFRIGMLLHFNRYGL